jgi:hypothetical protein
MNRFTKLIVFLVVSTSVTGCVFSAGTHGSLKGYQYAVTKDQLQNAVMSVIQSNPKILWDSLSGNMRIDTVNGKIDTTFEDYYNDIENYVTIKIKSGEQSNEYTFRYYGDEEHWKASQNSELFICYAYNKYRKGGHEGDEDFNDNLLNQLTSVFEKEVIDKLDQELRVKHEVTK